jgi:tape measure domain-containing protein
VRRGLQETGDLYTRIALSSKSLGISQNEALQMTESVNKAIILSGASTQEASAGMIQFGQALASGRLRGDELRSIMEQLPMVADIIARHLGVTRGELWALGHQGKITSLDLVEAFRDAREEIEERFGKFVPTLAQGFIAMRNAIIMTLGKFNEFGKIAQGFFKISTFIAKHTDEIARAALGATMAFGVFAGARGIGAVINALRALTVLLYANPLTIIGVAAIVAAGQLVAFSDQILVSAGSLITLQDFGIAAFQFMMDGIKAFIQYFNDNFGFIGDYAKETFGEFDSSILGERLKNAEGLLGESGPPNIPNPGDKDKGPESFEDVIKGIQVENELLALNRKEREIRQSLMDAEDRMERSMTAAEEALTRSLLEQNQVLQVQSDVLESIKGPEEDLIDRKFALIELFDQGTISVKEFQEAVRDLNVELTALDNTYSGGLENGLARMIQQSNELGTQVSERRSG